MECAVEACAADPVERLTVDDNGITVVLAVCQAHAAAKLNGAMVAAPVNATRGLIGTRIE